MTPSPPTDDLSGDAPASIERPTLARNPLGWILLLLLFGAMITSAVRASFGRVESDPAARLKPLERQLESLVSLAPADPKAKPKTEGDDPAAALNATFAESARRGYADLARDLRSGPAARTPRAALLRALVARERNGPPAPEDLALAATIAPATKSDPKAATSERRTDGKILGEDTKEERESAAKLREAARLVALDRPPTPPALDRADPFLLRLAAAQSRERAGLPRAEARKGLANPAFAPRTALLFGGGLLALAVGGAFWLALLVFGGGPALRPRGLPSLPMTRPEADRFLLRGALIFGGFLVLSTLLAALSLPRLLAAPLGLALYGGIALYSLRLPRDARVPNLSREGLRLNSRELGRRVLWGVGAAFANLPILLLVTAVTSRFLTSAPPPSHPATELLTGNPSVGAVLLTLFLASVCAPIWEETVFRGLLFQGFAGAFGGSQGGGSKGAVFGAALLSSFLFAAIHPQGPAMWAGLTTVALMSCALLRRTGSLVPSIVMHATHNTLILAAALLSGPVLG